MNTISFKCIQFQSIEKSTRKRLCPCWFEAGKHYVVELRRSIQAFGFRSYIPYRRGRFAPNPESWVQGSRDHGVEQVQRRPKEKEETEAARNVQRFIKGCSGVLQWPPKYWDAIYRYFKNWTHFLDVVHRVEISRFLYHWDFTWNQFWGF